MLDDCYFYLYSECKLKERCRYRHNPLSKDNLILCKNWSKNKKCRMDCPLRHSLYHVVKQRSDTMCYWEEKGGCTKYRCEFKHIDASKDEWKEPKVKLLTEIIESKNMHISEASTCKNIDETSTSKNIDETSTSRNIDEASTLKNIDVTSTSKNMDETSPVTISIDDAQLSVNNDVTISDAQVLLTDKKESTCANVTDKNESTCANVTDKKESTCANVTDKKESTCANVTDKKESTFANVTSGAGLKSVTSKSSDELLVNYELTTVNEISKGVTSISEDAPSVQNQPSIAIEDKTPSKRKNECQSEPKKPKTENLDFDIDNLDKEIAELEDLLNDS